MDINKELYKITELAYRYGKYNMDFEKFINCPDYKQLEEMLKDTQKAIDEAEAEGFYLGMLLK